MIVKTEETISVAHHLPNYHGKCHNLHGHNLKVEVWCEGEVDKKTGMVVDFVEIKKIINELDHKNLNNFIENPTSENLVKYFMKKIPKCVKVRVWENNKSYAEASK